MASPTHDEIDVMMQALQYPPDNRKPGHPAYEAVKAAMAAEPRPLIAEMRALMEAGGLPLPFHEGLGFELPAPTATPEAPQPDAPAEGFTAETPGGTVPTSEGVAFAQAGNVPRAGTAETTGGGGAAPLENESFEDYVDRVFGTDTRIDPLDNGLMRVTDFRGDSFDYDVRADGSFVLISGDATGGGGAGTGVNRFQDAGFDIEGRRQVFDPSTGTFTTAPGDPAGFAGIDPEREFQARLDAARADPQFVGTADDGRALFFDPETGALTFGDQIGFAGIDPEREFQQRIAESIANQQFQGTSPVSGRAITFNPETGETSLGGTIGFRDVDPQERFRIESEQTFASQRLDEAELTRKVLSQGGDFLFRSAFNRGLTPTTGFVSMDQLLNSAIPDRGADGGAGLPVREQPTVFTPTPVPAQVAAPPAPTTQPLPQPVPQPPPQPQVAQQAAPAPIGTLVPGADPGFAAGVGTGGPQAAQRAGEFATQSTDEARRLADMLAAL